MPVCSCSSAFAFGWYHSDDDVSVLFLQHGKGKQSHLFRFDNFLDVLAVLCHHLLLLFRQSLITATESRERGDSRLLSITPHVRLFGYKVRTWFEQKHTSSRCRLNMFTVRLTAIFFFPLFSLTSQNVLTRTAGGSKGLRKWWQTQLVRLQVCSPINTSRCPGKSSQNEPQWTWIHRWSWRASCIKSSLYSRASRYYSSSKGRQIRPLGRFASLCTTSKCAICLSYICFF